MNTSRRVFGALAAFILALSGVIGVSGTAQAVESSYSAPYIRMMDLNRYDILMESETDAIARDPAKAAWACKEVIGASALGGLLGVFASSSMCIPAVTVCAAQASTAGKWGGMTFTVIPPNFWCWKY
jgi:hypothetical protein